ncbi:MAG: hypothetical protein COA78_27985 [Blastopirellula sp.]|nr:MAG: hypothetical protein COA78_27985 [Blastopirellula sp.]
MGLDATVLCNCYREGKTSDLPFPLSWIELDEEGYYGLKTEYDSNDNYFKYHKWEYDCCSHAQMEYADVRIGNWPMVRIFQAALEKIGWNNFTVLRVQIPNANGGLTSSDDSSKARSELEFFESIEQVGSKAVLVDTSTGEELYENIAAYNGVFVLSNNPRINIGISDEDLFVVDSDSGKALFRAKRVRQFLKNGDEVSGNRDDIIWKNLETGTLYNPGVAIHGRQIPWEDGEMQNSEGKNRFIYPSEFHVEQRSQLASEFEYIVHALKTVFRASVETGNPVRWC